MDRIDAMRAFVAAVDRGSLAAAARTLGHSAASVTRAIALLEDRIGMPLLYRTTRALRLTPFGETYIATCRQVLATLDMAERGALAEQEEPSGLLTITAPVRFGQLHVRPVLDAFLDANPGVRARLLLLDRVVNLVEEGIDVAARVAHLSDSAMVATRIGQVRRVLCASPEYIARHGMPQTTSDLRDHACIMERDGAETELWRFASAGGKPLPPIAIRPRLVVNSAAVAVDSAEAGHGITWVMSYQAAAAVVAGKLTVLLAQYEPPAIPVHLVLPSSHARTLKQRAFLSFAAPLLRNRLATVESDIARAVAADVPAKLATSKKSVSERKI
jgi:DNA-binding transcriptional LysR family regulator